MRRPPLPVALGLSVVLAGVIGAQAPSASALATARPDSGSSSSPAAAASVQDCGQGAALTRPSSMILTCADHNTLAERLDWTSWTATEATASGQIKSIGSACAGGTNATLVLSDPVREGGGTEVLFTRLTVRITSGSDPCGYQRSATFDEAPAPAAPAPTGTKANTKIAGPGQDAKASPQAASGTIDYGTAEGFWVDAGGPSDLASTAAAIADAESSFRPGVIQAGEPYATTGWGLWQITPGDSAPSEYGSDYQVLDPWNNAEAAVWKYNEQGLDAWTTYYEGTYEQYLQSGIAPATGLTDPGEYVQVQSAPSDTPSSPGPAPGSTFGPGMPGTVSSGQIMFWHLSNSNSSGLQSQPTIPYGDTPDIPVTGDWTDQGYDTPGVFEQATATWNLDYNFNGGTGSVEFPFGAPGDLPVVGDWDGPSHGTEVGVYRQSDYTFYLQRADGSVTVIPYGNGAGWYPIAGDWTGQGYDSVGLFVPSTTGGPNAFYLRDGLGADPSTISLTLGDPGDEPIVGDWDNSGHTSIGVYRPSTYQFVEQLSSGSAADPTTLNAIRYGNPYSEPVIGHWSVGAPDTIGVIMSS